MRAAGGHAQMRGSDTARGGQMRLGAPRAHCHQAQRYRVFASGGHLVFESTQSASPAPLLQPAAQPCLDNECAGSTNREWAYPPTAPTAVQEPRGKPDTVFFLFEPGGGICETSWDMLFAACCTALRSHDGHPLRRVLHGGDALGRCGYASRARRHPPQPGAPASPHNVLAGHPRAAPKCVVQQPRRLERVEGPAQAAGPWVA